MQPPEGWRMLKVSCCKYPTVRPEYYIMIERFTLQMCFSKRETAELTQFGAPDSPSSCVLLCICEQHVHVQVVFGLCTGVPCA